MMKLCLVTLLSLYVLACAGANQLWMVIDGQSKVGVCTAGDVIAGTFSGPMGCSEYNIAYTTLAVMRNNSYNSNPIVLKGAKGQIHYLTFWTELRDNYFYPQLELYETGSSSMSGVACLGDKPLFRAELSDLGAGDLISASFDELDNALTVLGVTNQNEYKVYVLYLSGYQPPAEPVQGMQTFVVPRPSIVPSDQPFTVSGAVLMNTRVYVSVSAGAVGMLVAYDLETDNFTIVSMCNAPSVPDSCVISGLSRGLNEVLYFTQGDRIFTYDSVGDSLTEVFRFVTRELSHEGGAVESCTGFNQKPADCLYWAVTKQHKLAARYFVSNGMDSTPPLVQPSYAIKSIAYGQQGPVTCSGY